MNKLKISSLFLFLAQTSFAGTNFDSIKTWGSACPPNSLQSVTYAPDNNAISVIFGTDATLIKPKYSAGGTKTLSKDCTVQAHFNAKYDVQYVVLSADWRGFTALAPNSSATTKIDTWLTFKDLNGNLINTPAASKVSTVNGPNNDSTFFTTSTPDILTSTECGQNFDLNTKLTASLTNKNTTQDAQLGFDTLDIAQVREVACANPWKAELKNSSTDSITVKVNTESSKVNKLGSLYVVASYMGKLYAWTPNKSFPWTELSSDLSTGIPALGTANAPSQFEFQIGNLDPAAKGAEIYVGVGYGNDETARLNDLLNAQRYNAVYTLK